MRPSLQMHRLKNFYNTTCGNTLLAQKQGYDLRGFLWKKNGLVDLPDYILVEHERSLS